MYFITVILSVPIYSNRNTTGVFYWLENIELDAPIPILKK